MTGSSGSPVGLELMVQTRLDGLRKSGNTLREQASLVRHSEGKMSVREAAIPPRPYKSGECCAARQSHCSVRTPSPYYSGLYDVLPGTSSEGVCFRRSLPCLPKRSIVPESNSCSSCILHCTVQVRESVPKFTGEGRRCVRKSASVAGTSLYLRSRNLNLKAFKRSLNCD
jgi:hypothetical protein